MVKILREAYEERGGGGNEDIAVRRLVLYACTQSAEYPGHWVKEPGFSQGYTYPYSWGTLAMTDMFAGSWMARSWF